jgi:hypothetical protein
VADILEVHTEKLDEILAEIRQEPQDEHGKSKLENYCALWAGGDAQPGAGRHRGRVLSLEQGREKPPFCR